MSRLLGRNALGVTGQKKSRYLILLVSLATCAYLFDSIVSLTIPVAATERAPTLFQYFFDSFRNPVLLLAIYLGSLLELSLFFKFYPKMKKLLAITRKI